MRDYDDIPHHLLGISYCLCIFAPTGRVMVRLLREGAVP